MVFLDNQGYQENLVLLESQDWQGHLVIEVNQDHQAYQELENQEKMVLEGNQGSMEGKGNQALLVYQEVQACRVMVNQGFQDIRGTRDMLVSLDLQAQKVIKVMEVFQGSSVLLVRVVCLAHQVQ